LVAQAKQNFRLPLDSGQLTIIEGAIVEADDRPDGSEFVSFFINKDVSEWGTAQPGIASKNVALGTNVFEVRVRAVDFRAIINQYGMPYYMKIDIEGSDMVCIRALKAFETKPAYLSYEATKISLAALADELDLLQELGYTRFAAVEQSLVIHQVPPLTSREGNSITCPFPFGSSGLFGTDLNSPWCTRDQMLRKFRPIMLGYKLLGDCGALKTLTFPGARLLRGGCRRILQAVVGAPVPGWYDIHARQG
jgi:hypothetical protein